MRIFGIIGICILLPIASCSKRNNHFVKFPETVTVETSQQGFDSVYMRYPHRVRLFNSSLYVMDLHPDRYYCHEFEYPSMRFIQSFAKRGKAPNELISIGNIVVNDRGIVYMLNDVGRKIYTYEGLHNQINQLAELPTEMVFYSDFALLNDSTFIFPDYYGQCRLFFADRHGKIFRKMGSIPATERVADVPGAALGAGWRAFIGYNPHNGVVALATQMGEVLEIYNLHTDQTKVVVGQGGEPRCKYGINGATPDGILGYGDVYVGETLIYALFLGHEYEKILQHKITVEGGKYIHVFDLEGNPVRQYELDRYITGLYVDEAQGKVIGTDVNEEQLVIFDL